MSYTWPFPDGTPISQPFGSNPSNGFNPAGGHTGTDFAVPTGTPVMAIGAGTVQGVGQLPEPYTANPWWIEGQWAGNVVVIDHGPVVSVYAHLSEWHVNLGDTVTQGQVIGLSGATGGASTGPHCHFETIPNGWNFQNGTYGRVEPGTFCTTYWTGPTITAQSIPTPAPQEDTLSQAEVVQIQGFINSAQTEIQKSLENVQKFLGDKIDAAAYDVKTFAQKAGQDEGVIIINEVRANAAAVPASVLNAKFTLPDGTVTNLAGILGAIYAKPAGTVNAPSPDPQAIADAIINGINVQIVKK